MLKHFLRISVVAFPPSVAVTRVLTAKQELSDIFNQPTGPFEGLLVHPAASVRQKMDEKAGEFLPMYVANKKKMLPSRVSFLA